MERLKILDGLRGYCAIWIVFHHISVLLHLKKVIKLGIFTEGIIPVYLFFMLSGYVIAWLVEAKRESYSNFLLRRYFRLAPAYVLLCLISLTQLDLFISVLNEFEVGRQAISRRIATFEASGDHWLTHLALHATLLNGWFDEWIPKASKAFVAPGWSVTVEWQFYLFAPLLVAAFRKWWIVLVGAATLLLREHLGLKGQFVWDYMGLFLIGIGTYMAATHYANHFRKALPALVVGVVAYPIFGPMESPIEYAIWTWGAFTFLTRAELGPIRKGFRWIFENRVAVFYGKVSYSFYLSHMMMIYWVLSLTLPYQNDFTAVQFYLLNAALVLAALSALSALLYEAVESPCMKLGKRVVDRRAAKSRGDPQPQA